MHAGFIHRAVCAHRSEGSSTDATARDTNKEAFDSNRQVSSSTDATARNADEEAFDSNGQTSASTDAAARDTNTAAFDSSEQTSNTVGAYMPSRDTKRRYVAAIDTDATPLDSHAPRCHVEREFKPSSHTKRPESNDTAFGRAAAGVVRSINAWADPRAIDFGTGSSQVLRHEFEHLRLRDEPGVSVLPAVAAKHCEQAPQ